MDINEIENLKDAIAEDEIEKANNALEEDALYAMAESEGWKVMMKKFRKKINSLLAPIPHDEIVEVKDLALIGAMDIARTQAIKHLEEFVSHAESVKKARRAMMEKQKGTLKEEK